MSKTPYYLTKELKPNKEKKNPGAQRVSFESMEFDFTFLSDEEYIHMNKYLKNFMYQKFKYYDDEIVQKTLLQGCRFAHKYDSTKAKKGTWLCKILINIVFAEQKKNRVNISLDTNLFWHDNPTNDSGKKFSDLLRVEDDDDNNIPENYEEIIWQVNNNKAFYAIKMRVDGMSYSDIANSLGVTVSTVKSRLTVQRRNLRKLLEKLKGL